MDTQDSGKDVSENFFQELFKEESPDRSEPPISLDQEASVSFARDLFSQNLEDAARIMKLVEEIEALGKENLAARKSRMELFSLVLARAWTREELYRNGLFLPSFEENLKFSGYNVSILALACVVLVRNVNTPQRQHVIEDILEEALTSKNISKEGLAILKLCIATDRVITLNEEETKEVYEKGWEKHEELFHQWRSKAAPFLAQREHPTLQAFFEKQQKIGSEWPEVLYPMKYDISIYRQADECCYSTVDSPDWRKREISIRITDAAIDLLDEVLRTPIIEASCKIFSNPDRPHGKELMKNHFLCKFPYSAVPDLTRIKPQKTLPERYRFPGNNESKTVVVAVPQTTLIEIAQKIATFMSLPEGIPGTVFGKDIFKHLFSIFMTLMQPEYACMRSLEGNPKAPLITGEDRHEQTFSLASMFILLQFETARRALKQGMNPRLVDSLVEPYVLLEEEGDAERVRGMIKGGQSWEGIGLLSW